MYTYISVISIILAFNWVGLSPPANAKAKLTNKQLFLLLLYLAATVMPRTGVVTVIVITCGCIRNRLMNVKVPLFRYRYFCPSGLLPHLYRWSKRGKLATKSKKKKNNWIGIVNWIAIVSGPSLRVIATKGACCCKCVSVAEKCLHSSSCWCHKKCTIALDWY